MNNYEDELNYIIFVLGYDLLHDKLIGVNSEDYGLPCDLAYDLCDCIARRFLESEEYKNTRYSTYEMLEYWLRINEDVINKEYFEVV